MWAAIIEHQNGARELHTWDATAEFIIDDQQIESVAKYLVDPYPFSCAEAAVAGLSLLGECNRCANADPAIRYRFEFVGDGTVPEPDQVYRDTPLVVGSLELYGTEQYLVDEIREDADPPVVVLRRMVRG